MDLVSTYSAYSTPAPLKTVSMESYYNAGGGCFTGDCKTKLLNDVKITVDKLQVGMYLSSGSKILSIVKTFGDFTLVKPYDNYGPTLTVWHPYINEKKEWAFPDVEKSFEVKNTVVYNLVLDSIHIIDLDHVHCITLGHNKVGNNIIEHDYYGTVKIVKDLKQFPEWNKGIPIILTKYNYIRNHEGTVSSIINC